MSSLENWLKTNNLNIKLLAKLTENEITKVDDLKAFENEDDINELINDMGLKVAPRKKLKRAILKLIDDGDVDAKYEDSDDCLQESFIDPTIRGRRQPVWNSKNANDDIIKCIGSLSIVYDNDKLTQTETCCGTATIININDNGYGFLLTAAHNAFQFVRKCQSCGNTTISRKCRKCDGKCMKLKPKQLIKATEITFSQRCTEKTNFGNEREIYVVEDFVIRKSMYEKYSSGKDGYDICIMKIKCKGDIESAKYKNICKRIQLVEDPNFGSTLKAKLHIYGYPYDKGDGNQMYGMSNEMGSNEMDCHNFRVVKNDKTGKYFIENHSIDTQAGQSGAAIWTYLKGVCSMFNIYGVHVGGKQEDKLGVNFATYLDADTIRWINQAQFRLTLKPGFNLIPSEKREYIISDVKENMEYKSNNNQDKMFSIRTTFTGQNIISDVKIEQRKPQKLVAENEHKIILMCGETGCGKSSLINSLMNYIFDIKQGEKFRLKLIEEDEKIGGNATSHTEYITSYTIKKPKTGNIDYDLTIIDTPGFGDTHGIQKDIQIVKDFKYVFENILLDINGICFVIKSSVNRLTNSQKYIFNNILNLWGKNVEQNIFILMTFADAMNEPSCMDALKLIEPLKNCKQKYPMNNSAFLLDPLSIKNSASHPNYPIQECFWKMGMQCFTNFFSQLENIDPIPTEVSKNVLQKREFLKNQIRFIKESLYDALKKNDRIKKYKEQIRKKSREIDSGKEKISIKMKDTKVKMDVPKSETKHLICNVCKTTCHVCNWKCGKGKYYTAAAAVGTGMVVSPTAIAAGGALIGSFAGPIGAGVGYVVGGTIGIAGTVIAAKRMDKKFNELGITCCMIKNKQCASGFCACKESMHSQGFNKYVTQPVEVRESNWDQDVNMKNTYHKNKNELSKSQRLLRILQKELEKIDKKIERKIAMIQNLRNELEKIALRPKLTVVGPFIDELIQKSEESGDSNSVQMLKKLKEEEKEIEKLQEVEKISKEHFGYSKEKMLG